MAFLSINGFAINAALLQWIVALFHTTNDPLVMVRSSELENNENGMYQQGNTLS